VIIIIIIIIFLFYRDNETELKQYLQTHVDDLEDTVIALNHQMHAVKEELERQFTLNPDDEQLLKVIEVFNETFKEDIKMERPKQDVDGIVEDVINMLKKNAKKGDKSEKSEHGKSDNEKSDGTTEIKDCLDKKAVKEGGKTIVEESEDVNDAQPDGKPVEQKKMSNKYRRKGKKTVDKSVPSFTLLTPSSEGTDDDDCDDKVPINKPLDETEKLLWNFVMVIGMEKKM
jgi:hypothetical protein